MFVLSYAIVETLFLAYPEIMQFLPCAGFYGSSAANAIRDWEERLSIPYSKRLDSGNTSAYELGFDFVQIFTHIQHSTGVMMAR